MNTIFKSIGLMAGPVLFLAASCQNSGRKDSRKEITDKPNIILILADDLGYGELGCYGQKLIETPNIDQLAKDGIRLNHHYAGSPVCAPSRCTLLTGKHTGHADIRGNDEWTERGDVWNYLAMEADSTLEGEHPLSTNTKTIGNLLQNAGYTTGLIGKWGLGAPQTNSTPLQKGFDFFYGYICQRQAHTYYPLHLYKNDRRVYLNNDTVAPYTKLDAGADPYNISSYNKYNLKEYTPDLMFQELTRFVDNNKNNPFYLYWATPIPHVPLQAPPKWVDYYVKKFGMEEPYLGDKNYFPQRYPHACYAAMVSYLDWQVGQLVKQLKDLGIYENTLIIFTSDNGPTFNGGTDSPWFDSGGPFKSEYGWGKGFVHEAGIRVPFIATWPGHIISGTQSGFISAFWDVLPTLCEIAGIKEPDNIDGISFLPALEGKVQKEHEYLYWEFPGYNGQQVIRIGNWKGILENIQKGNMKIELYDLDVDIQEQNDIADVHPDIIKKIEYIMVKEHQTATIDKFKMKPL